MLFFIDWINTYFNTPKIQLTLDQELLGILGIGIVAVLVLSAIVLIGWIIIISKKSLHKMNRSTFAKRLKQQTENIKEDKTNE